MTCYHLIFGQGSIFCTVCSIPAFFLEGEALLMSGPSDPSQGLQRKDSVVLRTGVQLSTICWDSLFVFVVMLPVAQPFLQLVCGVVCLCETWKGMKQPCQMDAGMFLLLFSVGVTFFLREKDDVLMFNEPKFARSFGVQHSTHMFNSRALK